MSQLLQAASFGGLRMTVGAGVPDHFSSGIPYEADGSVAAVDAAPTHHHQGLGYDAQGRLCVLLGFDPNIFGNGTAPFLVASPGRLCAEAAAIDHYATGVPYTAGGRKAYTV